MAADESGDPISFKTDQSGLPTDPRVVEQVRSALLSYAANKISLTEAMRVVNNAYVRKLAR